MLSPEGQCKTFDEAANGYVRGEGCGVVILKPLSAALADNDRILALIKASGINQDGASSGLTVPNGASQEHLLTQVLHQAHLEPKDIDYIECHGTGTSLGDPIEVRAINAVYGKERSNPLYLGSTKSHIGHLEAAAGVAGLIKTVLALNHEILPAQLHFQQLNANITIDFPGGVLTQNQPWLRSKKPRRAGISSFGFSGTNAHVILEEAPLCKERDRSIVLPQEQLLVLSAKSKESLSALIESYRDYLTSSTDELADICYTAALGRNHFNYRVAIVARTKEELFKELNSPKLQLVEVSVTEEAIQSDDLTILRAAYLAGKTLDWNIYYAPNIKALNKISLPVYAFERQHYWLEIKEAKNGRGLSDWTFTEHWEELFLNKTSTTSMGKFTNTLVCAFEKNTLAVWQKIIRDPSAYFVLLPKDHLMLEELLSIDVNRVIILCDKTDETDVFLSSVDMLTTLMCLMKVLAAKNDMLELFVLTQHVQFLTQDKSPISRHLIATPILGFIKSLQIEIKSMSIRSIDVEVLNDEQSMGELIQDLSALPANEAIIARRHHQYFVPRLSKQIVSFPGIFTINDTGTYLITGGAGGLGQIICQWLIDNGAKHIVLIGRHSASRQVKDRIKQWQKQKINVILQRVDVSDNGALNKVILEIQATEHPLCGVFHLAGVEHSAYLADISVNDIADVLSAKVAGGYNLHELTKDMDLHCFVLFSSISAFLGSQKQSLYSAANQFLDQLARYRQQLSLPALSIAWGPWSETGMAVNQFQPEQMNQLGLVLDDFLSPTEVNHWLGAILTYAEPQVAIVSPNYLRFMLGFMQISKFHWIESVKTDLARNKNKSKDVSVDKPMFLSELLPLSVEDRHQYLIRLVRDIAASILGMENPEQIKLQNGFFDLGMDSIMTVELQKRLVDVIGSGIELKANLGFDYPNIEALSAYLYDELFDVQKIKVSSSWITQPLEPIAVIGMNCRFPGHANNPELFWDLLSMGQDGITEIPNSRWDMDLYYDPNPEEPGKSYTKKGGFIDDIDQFDPLFFNISPREAESMDPQQRLLLEVSYGALERAGYSLEQIKGTRGGVFIGVAMNEYGILLNNSVQLKDLSAYNATGNSLNVIAGRLSFTYGLEGPSKIIDTACSSSLVAIHDAIQALRTSECSFAIAGGVNVMVRPETFVMLCKAKMLSEDGYCKTFDAQADGYVRGEGCGVIILKRLSDALKDKDNILAVLKGSAVNQDGASSGLTVPRGPSQEAVIEQALDNARLKAEQVSYIEAHGTGTSLGDPIEVAALGNVYGKAHEKKPFILGTVKTNIGHLESAAGIAGVIKVILSLQHKAIPQHLHFNTINPHIDLTSIHAKLPLQLTDWKTGTQLRAAGVSSFGFSGTNAHLIIEEWPQLHEEDKANPCEADWVLCLSAKTQTALDRLIASYINYLESHPEASIQDVVYTANTGRSRFDLKACFKAPSISVLLNHLKTKKSTDISENTPEKANKIVLPTYPFDRQTYWLLETIGKVPNQVLHSADNNHPLLVRHMDLPEQGIHLFETDITTQWPEFVKDHLIYDKPVIAGATYISAIISAIYELHELKQAEIQCIEFIQPIILDNVNNKQRTVQIQINELEHSSAARFKVFSFADSKSERTLHAQGNFQVDVPFVVPVIDSLNAIKMRCTLFYSGDEHLKQSEHVALKLGHHFHWIEHVDFNDRELLARMRLPDKVERSRYLLYPGFIDSCFQTMLVWLQNNMKILAIPLSIQSFSYDLNSNKPEYVYIHLPEGQKIDNGVLPEVTLYLLDATGNVIAFIQNFVTRAVPQIALLNILAKQSQYDRWFYAEHWERQPLNHVTLPDTNTKTSRSLVLSPKEHPLIDGLRTFSVTMDLLRPNIELKIEQDYDDVWLLLIPPQDVEPSKVVQQYRLLMRAFFDSIKALMAHTWSCPPRLWIISRGLNRIIPGDEINLISSGISGFYKTLLQEQPQWQARLIDLGNTDTPVEFEQQMEQIHGEWLMAQTSSAQYESLLAFHNAERYVPRLMHLDEQLRITEYRDTPAKEPYRLHFDRGTLASMRFVPLQLPDMLPPDWVELKIEAAALNFRDVLNVQGLYPGDAGEAGGDCCGVITRLGSAVTHFNIGDRVFGMSVAAFASHALGPSEWLVKCPEFLRPIDACTLPAVFITSYVSLINLAQLKEGDTVLLHAASGGVGLAAIQIAQQVGATIIASAGSSRKRAYLKKLGVKHVFNSRNFDYVEPIKKLTQNRGVDVVLNFLVGDFIEQTLTITRQGGRFIEIGKRDIYSKEQMTACRPDIKYFIYALDDMMRDEPARIRSTLEVLREGIDAQDYQSLPATTFPLTHIVAAFNYMRGTKHIGKIVLTPAQAVLEHIDPEKSILIVGGFGGMGSSLIPNLIAQGVRHLILIGRQPLSSEIKLKLLELHEQYKELHIEYMQCDISKRVQTNKLMKQLSDSKTQLQAVFNTAGVLADSTLAQLTWDAFDAVIQPKVDGTWNLYQSLLLHGQSDVAFISSSSIASTLGSPGQANYAAANSFLDAFSRWQSSQRMNAITLCWGPWSELGMAKNLTSRHGRGGIQAFKPAAAISALHHLLQMRSVPPVIAIADFRWQQVNTLNNLSLLNNLLSKKQADEGDWLKNSGDLSEEERGVVLHNKVHQLVADVLGMSVDSTPIDKGFFEMGMDSLMAVELRNQIQVRVGKEMQLKSTLIFDYPSVKKIVFFLMTNLGLGDENQKKSVHLDKESEHIHSAVKNLDIDYIEKYLDSE